MQTILGANGTIGKLLAKELITYTNKIRLVSRNPKKINPSDELFAADLTDISTVDKAIAGSQVVYLVIGLEYNKKVWREQWPKIMHAVINSCKRHNSKLVFFDNVYMYDIKGIPHMTENSPVNPPSEKGWVRKEINDMLLKEIKTGQIKALIARAADFYGPDCEKSLFHLLVYTKLKRGKSANWLVDADKKHTFTYTPDAAKATALLGNTPDAYNQIWHLPTDKNALTGRQYVSLIANLIGKENKLIVIPNWMIKVMGVFIPFMKELHEMLYQYDREYIFNSFKFESRFNFKPTSYADGIAQMLNVEKTKQAAQVKAESI